MDPGKTETHDVFDGTLPPIATSPSCRFACSFRAGRVEVERRFAASDRRLSTHFATSERWAVKLQRGTGAWILASRALLSVQRPGGRYPVSAICLPAPTGTAGHASNLLNGATNCQVRSMTGAWSHLLCSLEHRPAGA
jgi:hypothetical protein